MISRSLHVPGLGFVGIDHQIGRASVAFFGHKRPLQSGGKPGSAAPAQTRSLHFVDDPVTALVQNFAVPSQ